MDKSITFITQTSLICIALRREQIIRPSYYSTVQTTPHQTPLQFQLQLNSRPKLISSGNGLLLVYTAAIGLDS